MFCARTQPNANINNPSYYDAVPQHSISLNNNQSLLTSHIPLCWPYLLLAQTCQAPFTKKEGEACEPALGYTWSRPTRSYFVPVSCANGIPCSRCSSCVPCCGKVH